MEFLPHAETAQGHLATGSGDAAQKQLWTDLVQRIPAGVLFDCDAYIVELTVRLTEKMRQDELTVTEVSQYRGCLASLGLTPADRTRVAAPEELEVDPLAAFIDAGAEAPTA